MKNLYFILFVFCVLQSCGSYKQNILFKPTEDTKVVDKLTSDTANKKVALGDYLELEVYTKYGEKIIDPDFELNTEGNSREESKPELKYLVRENGLIKLPLIGDIELLNLTLNEAESILEEKYNTFYKESFVKLSFSNKRVVVLGAPGGQIIPLDNENVELVEILALAQGIDNDGKGHNIRILRDKEVFIADLTTIEGYQRGNILVEHGDVIYIEPVRRPFSEFLRENGQVFTILISLLTLSVVLSNNI